MPNEWWRLTIFILVFSVEFMVLMWLVDRYEHEIAGALRRWADRLGRRNGD